MNLLENIREGFRSIGANLLRSILTSAIVAIGIMALVGILTAIDGIEKSVTKNLSSLGLNTFSIHSVYYRNASRAGVEQKRYPPVRYTEAKRFVNLYQVTSNIGLSATVTGTAEVKRLSKKSNPNVRVMGINDEYMSINALEFNHGRNLSRVEMERGRHVIILGGKVAELLYEKNEDPVNTNVTVLGTQFRVIGVLEKKGDLSEDNYDNMAFVPLMVGNQLAEGNALEYTLKIGVSEPNVFDFAMGEATGLMRSIRQDAIGEDNSFVIEKSDNLSDSVGEVTSALYIGGIGIGFITLLGASIALMNIMMVSVTERTREVGLRKALGATALRIRQQFIIEAIVVCLVGGLAGILLGWGIGILVTFSLGIEGVIVPWLWMLIGVIVCIVVGLISGYYPAHKASKLDPIESLRFE